MAHLQSSKNMIPFIFFRYLVLYKELFPCLSLTIFCIYFLKRMWFNDSNIFTLFWDFYFYLVIWNEVHQITKVSDLPEDWGLNPPSWIMSRIILSWQALPCLPSLWLGLTDTWKAFYTVRELSNLTAERQHRCPGIKTQRPYESLGSVHSWFFMAGSHWRGDKKVTSDSDTLGLTDENLHLSEKTMLCKSIHTFWT